MKGRVVRGGRTEKTVCRQAHERQDRVAARESVRVGRARDVRQGRTALQ